jgi:hypothetical protein
MNAFATARMSGDIRRPQASMSVSLIAAALREVVDRLSVGSASGVRRPKQPGTIIVVVEPGATRQPGRAVPHRRSFDGIAPTRDPSNHGVTEARRGYDDFVATRRPGAPRPESGPTSRPRGFAGMDRRATNGTVSFHRGIAPRIGRVRPLQSLRESSDLGRKSPAPVASPRA